MTTAHVMGSSLQEQPAIPQGMILIHKSYLVYPVWNQVLQAACVICQYIDCKFFFALAILDGVMVTCHAHILHKPCYITC